MTTQGRADLVIVANRLPVDRVTNPDGSNDWRRSPGGLVSALEPVMRANDGAWIGWPGAADDDLEPFVEDGLQLVPVHLSAQEVEEFYEGFSNGTLWPLYHDLVAKPEFHREWWDSYVTVNRRFAEKSRRGRRRGRHRLGPGLPAPAGAADAPRPAPRPAHRLLPAHPLPARPSCSASCRGAARSSRACWAPT